MFFRYILAALTVVELSGLIMANYFVSCALSNKPISQHHEIRQGVYYVNVLHKFYCVAQSLALSLSLSLYADWSILSFNGYVRFH